MTVIAYRSGVMAADRDMHYGSMKMPTKKIFRVRDHLIGASGNSDQIAAFVDWFDRGCVAAEYPTLEDSSVLVVDPKRKARIYWTTAYPVPVRGRFIAIGAGSDAAMAAMIMHASARQAVVVASRVCHNVGGGVDVERL